MLDLKQLERAMKWYDYMLKPDHPITVPKEQLRLTLALTKEYYQFRKRSESLDEIRLAKEKGFEVAPEMWQQYHFAEKYLKTCNSEFKLGVESIEDALQVSSAIQKHNEALMGSKGKSI